MKKTARWLLIRASLVCCVLQATAAEKPWPVHHQSSYAQCPLPMQGPAVKVFSHAAVWQKAVTGTPWLASPPVAAFAPSGPPRGQVHLGGGPAIDFRTQNAIVFGLATQPSLGVSVRAQTLSVSPRGQLASLWVKVERPAPGAMVLTALSQPCVLLVVPKQRWQVLQVRDADHPDHVWATLKTPPNTLSKGK